MPIEQFLKEVSTDVVVSPWYYLNLYEDTETTLPKLGDPADPDNYNEFLLAKIASFTSLPENGYDIIPVCSNCYNPYNVDHTIRYCVENVPSDKLRGIAIAPWNGNTTEKNKFGFFSAFVAAKEAIENGADEVDVVINIGKAKSGDFSYVKNEIEKIRA